MKRHRNPRPRLPKRPTPDNRRAAAPPPPAFDLDGVLAVLRDDLGRADTMLVTAALHGNALPHTRLHENSGGLHDY